MTAEEIRDKWHAKKDGGFIYPSEVRLSAELVALQAEHNDILRETNRMLGVLLKAIEAQT